MSKKETERRYIELFKGDRLLREAVAMSSTEEEALGFFEERMKTLEETMRMLDEEMPEFPCEIRISYPRELVIQAIHELFEGKQGSI